MYGWIWMKTWILITLHSDAVCCQLNLDGKDDSWSLQQWFRMFSAQFEWERWNLIIPPNDAVFLQLNLNAKLWIQVTLHSDAACFQLNLDVKHKFWSLRTVIPYMYSWIWTKNVNPDHSRQWFRMLSAQLDEKGESWSLHTVGLYNYGWVWMQKPESGSPTSTSWLSTIC